MRSIVMTKRIALFTMVLAVLLTACRTSDGLTKDERAQLVAQQVVTALENRHYTIAVDWMKPLGGM